MLKGLDVRLNAEVLYALRAMGHGDTVALVDTNFPADSVARQTTYGRLIRMENLTAAEAAEAVLSVLPLDTFVEDFALRMERGQGLQAGRDGLVTGNAWAGYIHIHALGEPHWAPNFVAAAVCFRNGLAVK